METENDIERDLFGAPIATAPAVLVETLGEADLIETLGAVRLMEKLSSVLRADSKAAGWTILLDGLPAIFDRGMDHTRRSSYAALAGLIEDPMLELLSGRLPGEDAINEAVKLHAAELAPRWRAALSMLERMVKLSSEEKNLIKNKHENNLNCQKG